jgi:hypothetical protein
MIGLDDEVWAELEGGYRGVRFDASRALRELKGSAGPSKEIWEVLWENLYHQGDVGASSYAAVVQLARIYREKGWLDGNLFMFAATVERARPAEKNPEVPQWLAEDYSRSLRELLEYGMDNIAERWEYNAVLGFLMLAALVQGRAELAELLNYVDEGYERELIERITG